MSVLKQGPTVVPQTYTCTGCSFLTFGEGRCGDSLYFCSNAPKDNFLGYSEDVKTPDWCEFLPKE